jgi:hypothetical protein
MEKRFTEEESVKAGQKNAVSQRDNKIKLIEDKLR